MKSIFEKDNYNELVNRLQKLSDSSAGAWGKMDVSQMLHHLNLTMEVPLGKVKPITKPNFIMRIFKGVLYNDKPFGKGDPTPKDFKVTSAFNYADEKQKVLNNLQEIYNRGKQSTYNPHVFFGSLSSEQWGMHFYKHTDHHLKQFGV